MPKGTHADGKTGIFELQMERDPCGLYEFLAAMSRETIGDARRASKWQPNLVPKCPWISVRPVVVASANKRNAAADPDRNENLS